MTEFKVTQYSKCHKMLFRVFLILNYLPNLDKNGDKVDPTLLKSQPTAMLMPIILLLIVVNIYLFSTKL